MFENLARADILLHVESFEEKEKNYFRLSMSTKIPEYLSVGRPVLVVGPDDIGSVEYIRQNHVGYAVNRMEECPDLFAKLNREELQRIGKQALSVAKNSHLQSNIQNLIYQVFEDSIRQYQCID